MLLQGYFCVKMFPTQHQDLLFFFQILMNTDHLFGNLTVSISVNIFFPKSELKKFQLGALKDSFFFSSECEFKKHQGVHYYLETDAVVYPQGQVNADYLEE